jgi:hypothetical protein
VRNFAINDSGSARRGGQSAMPNAQATGQVWFVAEDSGTVSKEGVRA